MPRGQYDRTKVTKHVDAESIIAGFKAYALQSPYFTCYEATKAGLWSAFKSKKLGLLFNDMKKLAGLPIGREGKKKGEYIPKYDKTPKTTKKRPCLGILPNESYCTAMATLPARLCKRCKDRINSI